MSKKLLLIEDWNWHRDPQMANFEALIPNWGIFIKPLPSRLKDLCRRGNRWLKARGDGWLQRSSVFHEQQIWCTCKLTETVAVHVKPGQSQTGSQLWDELADTGFGEQRSYLLFIPTGKGKISFLQWSLSGHINYTRAGCMPRSTWPTQKEPNAIFVGFLPCFLLC